MNKYSDMHRPLTSKFTDTRSPLLHSKSSRDVYEHKVSSFFPPSNFEETESTKYAPSLKSGIVSDLARIENEKVMQKTRSLNHGVITSHLGSQKALNGNRPSQRDFNDLMNKLDSIISCQANAKILFLHGGVPLEVEIRQGNIQQFKVVVKGQRSPLKITIRREFGQVKSFLSKSTNEPKETECDHTYTSDTIFFSDPSYSFNCEYINLGIRAIERTKFNIAVKFGKEKKTALKKLEKIENQPPIKRKKTGTLSNKNFLSQKRHTLPSTAIVSTPRVRIMDWNQRRKEVIQRKTAIMEEKKERRISMLNRFAERHQKERKEREHKQNLTDLEKRQRLWLTVIRAVSVLDVLGNIRQQIRSGKGSDQTKNNSAKKGQVSLRSQLSSDINLIRSADLLELFRSAHSITYTNKVPQFISQSAKNEYPINVFSEYLDRVIRIQRLWRSNLQQSKKKYQDLVNLWKETISQMVTDEEALNPKEIKGTSQYLRIKAIHRDAVLKEYFQRKKYEFMVNVRMYLDSANCVKRQVISKINENYKDIYNQGFPKFKCRPSREEIVDLIEEAKILSRY